MTKVALSEKEREDERRLEQIEWMLEQVCEILLGNAQGVNMSESKCYDEMRRYVKERKNERSRNPSWPD